MKVLVSDYKVLVTGVAGFMGSFFSKGTKLLREDSE